MGPARALVATGALDAQQASTKHALCVGETKLLRRQLVRRFGPLPTWAEARLERAGEADPEVWADRVLDGTTMEDVLKEPI